MCTLHFVWISESMAVTLSVHLYLSDNCVINALPGYSMVFFLAKNIKPKMIILCKLSI